MQSLEIRVCTTLNVLKFLDNNREPSRLNKSLLKIKSLGYSSHPIHCIGIKRSHGEVGEEKWRQATAYPVYMSGTYA